MYFCSKIFCQLFIEFCVSVGKQKMFLGNLIGLFSLLRFRGEVCYPALCTTFVFGCEVSHHTHHDWCPGLVTRGCHWLSPGLSPSSDPFTPQQTPLECVASVSLSHVGHHPKSPHLQWQPIPSGLWCMNPTCEHPSGM